MANATLTTRPPLPLFTRESAGFHMFLSDLSRRSQAESRGHGD